MKDIFYKAILSTRQVYIEEEEKSRCLYYILLLSYVHLHWPHLILPYQVLHFIVQVIYVHIQKLDSEKVSVKLIGQSLALAVALL